MPWTSISLNPPPTGITLFVQYGGSIFFAAKNKWNDKWFHLHNGTESECPEPEVWWDETIGQLNETKTPESGTIISASMAQKQLTFDL